MKKIATIIFVLLFIPFFQYINAQGQETPPVEFKKISENLYELLGGRGANGGVYIGDNEVLIIDAKMDQNSVDQVINGLKEITDKPIKYLVNTHSDGDHVSGNIYFPETTIIISHKNCREEFYHPRGGNPSNWSDPEMLPFMPSITFSDNMVLFLGSKKVELWYFGVGHTTGDAVVYFPEERTAFLGDQIFLGRPQLIHSYKGGDSFEYVKTLENMLETINARNFCSGHSEIADRESVRSHIDKVKSYQEKIKSLIKEGKVLEEINKDFEENELRLVSVIYEEIAKCMDKIK